MTYDTVVFADASSDDLAARLKTALYDGQWLLANQVRVPEVFFERTNDDDRCWHEYVEISASIHDGTDVPGRSFKAFVDDGVRAAAEGCREFDGRSGRGDQPVPRGTG